MEGIHIMADNSLDFSELERNLQELDRKTRRGFDAAFAFQASRSLGEMKTQAPWTDRTGAARAGLNTNSGKEGPDTWVLTLAHGVSYGIWLELANSGTYAIVVPHLSQAARELAQLLKGMWGRL
jgi:hypothetical protein